MDPDDVFNDSPDRWDDIIKAAKPIVIHVMETLAANRDLDDPKTKTEIAAQVLPLIADVSSSIERDTYRQRLARTLRVDERTLVVSRKAGLTRKRVYPDRQTQIAKTTPQRKITSITSAVQTREVHILGVLIRHPDLIYHMDRQLQEDGLNRISEKDFQHSDHQALFQLINNSLDQDHAEPLNHVLNHLIDEMIPFVDDILAKTEKIDPQGQNVLEDILRALILLRDTDLSRQIDHLRYLQQAAQEEGNLKAEEYQQIMTQYITLLGRLHRARNRYTHHAMSAQ
jgi:DNA primase